MNDTAFPVADCHCDTVWLFGKNNYDFARHNPVGHIDLPRLLKGGVTLQFFAVCVAGKEDGGQYLKRSLQYIQQYHHCLQENRNHIAALKNLSDMERAEQEGKISCLLALEGAEALEESLELLDIFYRLGVRCISLTWNNRNWLADGVGDTIRGGGLTKNGRKFVELIAEKGIILDLAHIAPRCFYDAIDLTTLPPLVSHANARTLCDHPRNLEDRQLKVLAEKKGVLGLSFSPPFISGKPGAQLEQLIDHFVHVAEVAGVEHVGIGSDYDGIQSSVQEMPDASCYPVLLEALRQRGFSDREVQLLAGGNVKRLVRDNLQKIRVSHV